MLQIRNYDLVLQVAVDNHSFGRHPHELVSPHFLLVLLRDAGCVSDSLFDACEPDMDIAIRGAARRLASASSGVGTPPSGSGSCEALPRTYRGAQLSLCICLCRADGTSFRRVSLS